MENIKNLIQSKLFFNFSLLLLFVLGFAVRLYRFDGPIADWHSWRQADTSAVSRFLIKDGFDMLHPRYYDVSKIQTGLSNPQGYRFVEFPLYNFFQAAGYKFIGFLTLEEWGRIVTIISSLLCGMFLYLITKKHFGTVTSLFTLIFYLFTPFSIYYGRTILPDTSMIMASLGGIYFFEIYISKKSKSKYLYLLISTLFTACSLLLKPYAIFFALPQLILAFQKYKYRLSFKIELWIHLLLSIIPLVLWRIWMLQYPEGIPTSLWLLNGNGIRFRPAFFRWILYERLTKLILGYAGVIFLFFGLLKLKKTKKILFPLSFIISSILYVCIFATGNVQHDYYQILVIPSIAIICGLGASYIYSKNNLWKAAGLIIFGLFIYFSWNRVKDYFNINNRAIIVAGKKADEILPKDTKVLAPLDGDTTLLYYTNRQGWPAATRSPEELKARGAGYMVIVNPTPNDFSGYGKKYKVRASSSQYLILEL